MLPFEIVVVYPGSGMWIRDSHGEFVAGRTQWMAPTLQIHEGEAAGLLFAL